MTYDLVVLSQRAPNVRAIVDSMVDAGETLRVRGSGEGALIQMCDDDGNPLLSIESAQRVEVAGEVERLLGEDVTDGLTVPFWWVEARATDADPRGPDAARRFAAAMVGRLGGTVWPPRDRPGAEPGEAR